MRLPSLAAWLMLTCRSVACSTRPSIPLSSAADAPACRLVHLRDGSLWSVAITSANSASLRRKPISSSLPPSIPTNAFRLLPPMVSMSVSTTLASPSVTCCVFISSAKSPLNCTKPNTSISSAPLASSMLPLLLVADSFNSLPATVVPMAWSPEKSATGCPVDERL